MTAQEEFIQYTNKYKKYGEMIDLKTNHTFRVQKLCEELAESEGLTNEQIELASICGLLHDIGRFEQWKRYKSYKDLNTIDHGELGVEILKDNYFISKFSPKNHNIILMSVKYHNKYKVPNNLKEINKYYTNIVRDADKLDILYLFSINNLKTKNAETKMSTKIYNTLINKKQIKRVDVKTKADEIAIRLGFIFDLNFKKSYEIVKENNYINKVIDNQIIEINNKELINQLEELRIHINNYIEEMISC